MKSINNFVSPGHRMFETSVQSFLPHFTMIPFCQADGVEYQPAVKPGDVVAEGDTIASLRGLISSSGADIHSSVPGVVESIEQCTLPNGNLSYCAKILTKGEFSYLGKIKRPVDWDIFATATLLEEFREKGIVNTFTGKAVSLSSQIKDSHLEKNRFVVVRMFDDDPGRFTDSFVASHCTEKVIEGAKIAARAFDAEGIAFVIARKSDFTIDEKLLDGYLFCTVFADASRYPVGQIHSMMRLVRKISKVPEYEKFRGINHKCLYLDSTTCSHIYDAIALGVPLVETYVHVTGSCLKSAAMFKVRIGTTFRELAEQCGGFTASPAKIIVNGRILGRSVSNIDIPVTKDVKSIEFLSGQEICNQHTTKCIRCGNCRSSCPEHLVPDLLYRKIAENYQLPKEISRSAIICGQCSLCNCVCPARLPLSQTIAILKSEELNG